MLQPLASWGTGRISRLRGLAKALGSSRFQWRVQRGASCQVRSQPCVHVPGSVPPCRGVKGPELFLKHGFLSVTSWSWFLKLTLIELKGQGPSASGLSLENAGDPRQSTCPHSQPAGSVLPKHFSYVMARAPKPWLPLPNHPSPSEHHDQEAAVFPCYLELNLPESPL